MAIAEGRNGIGWVVARHDIEQQSSVRDGPRDRADFILGLAVWNNAGAAHEAARRTYAHQIVGGCGGPYRLPGIAAGAQNGEVGRDGRAGAAAGTAGRAGKVIRVADLAAQTAERHAAA